jgi:hypothetical protein
MTQEESHPDQEGHADNRRRRQSGQVTEQGALLSGRPASLPARTAACSAPALIGVTADEHWVIRHGATYALLLIANQRLTAPLPVAGRGSSRRPEAGAGPGGGRPSPPDQIPPPGNGRERGGTREAPEPAGGHDGRADRSTGWRPTRVPPAGRPGVPARRPTQGASQPIQDNTPAGLSRHPRRPIQAPPQAHPARPAGPPRAPPQAHPGHLRRPRAPPQADPECPPAGLAVAPPQAQPECRPHPPPGPAQATRGAPQASRGAAPAGPAGGAATRPTLASASGQARVRGRSGRPPGAGQNSRTCGGRPSPRAGPEPRPRHRPPWQDPRRSRRFRGLAAG